MPKLQPLLTVSSPSGQSFCLRLELQSIKYKQQSMITDSRTTCKNTFQYPTMNCSEKCCCTCIKLSRDSAHVLCSSIQLDTAVQSKAIYPYCSPSSYHFHCSRYLLYICFIS